MIAVESTTMGPLRVLVVDDEKRFASAFKRRLELMGASAEIALDREQALAAYRSFDVIFIDLALGLKSGLDVARQILADQNQKWIYLMSAHEEWLSRSVRSDLPTRGCYAKPMSESADDDIRSELDELRRRKSRRDEAVNSVVEGLRLAAESASTASVEAQIALGRAKKILEDDLLRTTRRRKGDGQTSARRAITLMVWASMSRLSFVPSDHFGFTVPEPDMLEKLAACVEILRGVGLGPSDEQLADKILRSAGLSMAPNRSPETRPDLTVDQPPDSPQTIRPTRGVV